jgi:hypothetical protein
MVILKYDPVLVDMIANLRKVEMAIQMEIQLKD